MLLSTRFNYPGVRLIVCFIICFSILFMITPAKAGTSGTGLLKENPSEGQEVRTIQGSPLIISNKIYRVAILPDSIMMRKGDLIRFSLMISNPTDDPLEFKMTDIKVHTNDGDMQLVTDEMMIEKIRKEFSNEEYDINKDQEKILKPYIEEKIRILENSLLKDHTLQPGKQMKGMMAIEYPSGKSNLTFEINTPAETHKFDFSVIEF